MIISAVKNNEMVYGQLPKVADEIGIGYETLRRRKRDAKKIDKKIIEYNDWIVYFNTKKI